MLNLSIFNEVSKLFWVKLVPEGTSKFNLPVGYCIHFPLEILAAVHSERQCRMVVDLFHTEVIRMDESSSKEKK